jgi:molybdopterin/thiamine biosynthesis adenylyltransferase
MRDVTTFRPEFPDSGTAAALAADPTVVVVDELRAQLEQLAQGRSPGEPLTGDSPQSDGVWVFFPWRRTLVRVLPEELHRELRLDRNRYAITPDEQRRLGGLRIAVAGLSVGRAVVSAMAHEGIGGELRLADFDVLDLSNLNRISGGVADVGVSKVVLAAREVAELDPYVRVVAFPGGVQDETIAEFVEGADVVVDECDDLAMKVLLREQARAAGRPVVMATSHRGMLDVERFDLEPDRPVFHGLLGGVGSADLRGLTTKQKVPYVMRILDAASLTDRIAASLVEVKETVSTWPQLASDVALGGAMVANAVRRIALGELTCSGRFYADLDELTADGRQVPLRPPPTPAAAPARQAPPRMPAPNGSVPGRDELRFVVACASRAPSGGNMQPWRFEAHRNVIRASIDPARSSLLDFRHRAALLALGAALEGATIGARALGFEPVVRTPHGPVWELALERSTRRRDERAVEVLWQRCSNRRAGAPVADDELARLAAFGAPLRTSVVERGALAQLGTALGGLDRVRFLSPRLRRDLIGELRFTPDEAQASRDGIDVAALELDATDRAAMDVLRTGAGLDVLAAMDRGWGLRNSARDAFAQAGGAIVLRAAGTDRVALLDAGRGLMRLWLEATRRELAVHPWGSPFLFQRLLEDAGSLEGWERSALTQAADAFGHVVAIEREHPILLILRISRSDPPSTRSLRRPVAEVLREREPAPPARRSTPPPEQREAA